MGQLVMQLHVVRTGLHPVVGRSGDPGAAARGILLALAISTLFWIALALAVPRLW